MCERFTLIAENEEIIHHYGLNPTKFPSNYTKTYNASPSQKVLGILGDDDQSCRAGYIQWGIPKPKTSQNQRVDITFNMKSENIETVKESIQRRRIIIPVDSYYQWGKNKTNFQPSRVLLKTGKIFSLAGLFEIWDTPEGKTSGCVILTTQANPALYGIHPRMPVIIPSMAENIWLDRSNQNINELQSMLKPFPALEMENHLVSSLVNNIEYNSSILIRKEEPEPNLF